MAGPDTYVRLALPKDVDDVAAIQSRAWAAAYPGLLPPVVLSQLEPAARAQWEAVVRTPISDAHHLLVAIVRLPPGEKVVGFAAVNPSTDADADPQHTGSLTVLAVDPDHQGHGHGSRLLAAAIQTLRTSRFGTATCWLPEVDQAQRAFLESAGWHVDGARRALDTGAGSLAQVRFHTALV